MCTLNRILCTSKYTPSRRWVIGLLLTALVVGYGGLSWAEGEVVGTDFAITWTASPTPQVSEYRLYVTKTKGVYDRKSYLAVPAPATKASGAALKLTTDGQYYLIVTAAIPGGSLSDDSAEVPFVRETSAVPVPPVQPVAPVIADVTLPLVAIRAPVDGAEVARNTTVQVEVDASDNVGITRLALTVSGQPLCVLFTEPWRCAWKVPGTAGKRYTINAQAIDQAGNNAQQQIEVVAK